MKKIGIFAELGEYKTELLSFGNISFESEIGCDRLKDSNIVIVDPFITSIDEEFIKDFSNLEHIILNTTGFDNVDIDLLSQKGIKLHNLTDYSSTSVAEFTLMQILAVNKNLHKSEKLIDNGVYEIIPHSDEYRNIQSNVFENTKVGIIGFGNIGRKVASYLKALGIDVFYTNFSGKKIEGYKYMALEKMLQVSDILSIHLPLKEDTIDFIGRKEFEQMKNGVSIINNSRENIINMKSLLYNIDNGKIGTFATDVVTPGLHKELSKYKNVIITPHNAYNSKLSEKNIIDEIKDILKYDLVSNAN